MIKAEKKDPLEREILKILGGKEIVLRGSSYKGVRGRCWRSRNTLCIRTGIKIQSFEKINFPYLK